MATVPKPVHDDLYEVSCFSWAFENSSHVTVARRAEAIFGNNFLQSILRYSILALEGEPHCLDAEEPRKSDFRDGLFVSATS